MVLDYNTLVIYAHGAKRRENNYNPGVMLRQEAICFSCTKKPGSNILIHKELPMLSSEHELHKCLNLNHMAFPSDLHHEARDLDLRRILINDLLAKTPRKPINT